MNQARNAEEKLHNSISDKLLLSFMRGYIDSVDWCEIPFDDIIDNPRYKETCLNFAEIITANTATKADRNATALEFFNHPFMLRYRYFNRPEEWTTHNPIDITKLDSFTMHYISQSEYHNDKLSIEIIKAYIMSAAFDNLYSQLAHPNEISKKASFFIANSSIAKYTLLNALFSSIKLVFKWFSLPALSLFLYHKGNIIGAQVITGIYAILIFMRLDRLLSTTGRQFFAASKQNNLAEQYELLVYITNVLSQDVIHIKSLKALIRQSAEFTRTTHQPPLNILLDLIEEKRQYINNHYR